MSAPRRVLSRRPPLSERAPISSAARSAISLDQLLVYVNPDRRHLPSHISIPMLRVCPRTSTRRGPPPTRAVAACAGSSPSHRLCSTRAIGSPRLGPERGVSVPGCRAPGGSARSAATAALAATTAPTACPDRSARPAEFPRQVVPGRVHPHHRDPCPGSPLLDQGALGRRQLGAGVSRTRRYAAAATSSPPDLGELLARRGPGAPRSSPPPRDRRRDRISPHIGRFLSAKPLRFGWSKRSFRSSALPRVAFRVRP